MRLVFKERKEKNYKMEKIKRKKRNEISAYKKMNKKKSHLMALIPNHKR